MELWIQVGGGLPYPFARSRSWFIVGEALMDLHLQFGFGMMSHTRELIDAWGGGTVILSPRDLTREQMLKLASDVGSRGGHVLFDPQCFARESDHERLVAHEYFAEFQAHSTSGYKDGPGISKVLAKLAAFGRELKVQSHILPSMMIPLAAEPWFAIQDAVLEAMPAHYGDDPVLATLPLSAEAMLDEGRVESIIEHVRTWPVSGFYVVAENPTGYLVDNPVWLANLLLLVSGLKLQGKKVVVGYCSHQMLALAAAKADAIAAGTWLNVRAFSPDRFSAPEEGAVSRRATWYYCPQALSEFKIPFLDIAKRMGVLEEMRPPKELDNPYCAALFAGPAPTSIEWGEQSAFRHYLSALRAQAALASKSTFQETVEFHQNTLTSSNSLLQKLHKNAVFGQDRDFEAIIDVNRAALTVYDAARGPLMRRSW